MIQPYLPDMYNRGHYGSTLIGLLIDGCRASIDMQLNIFSHKLTIP